MKYEDSKPTLSAIRIKALKRSGLLIRTEGDRFDKLAEHVRIILGTPTAIITLIDDDRQVFAGECGLPAAWAGVGETPLSHSFCKHVVERDAPMMVPNAHEDPTVRDNLAVEDIGIVAYLGVPLHLPTGEVVGAVAAIDQEPRDWTQADLRKLQSAATMIESEIEVRLSEIKWRTLFQDMQEGFYVGETIRDASGQIADFRFIDINPAFEHLTGLSPAATVGLRLSDAFPDIETGLLEAYARVVETGEPSVFEIHLPSVNDDWFEVRARRLDDDRFAAVFSKITARKHRDIEMVELEERRRLAADVGEVGLWDFDPVNGNLTLDERMREFNGVRPGREFDGMDAFGAIHPNDRRRVEAEIDRVVRGEDDVLALQYRVVGIDDGIVRAVYVNGRSVRDRNGKVVRLLGAARDITARVAAEDRQSVLNHELAHRLKNTLAVVQSIVTQTLRSAPDIPTAREALSKRIQALAKAHDVLLAGHGDAGAVEAIIRGAIDLHDPNGRITLHGPNLYIGPKAALTLALIMHELSTNAAKYGALSVPDGKVDLTWVVEVDQETRMPTLALSWCEIDGPPATPPTRKGFGTRLIEMGLSGSIGGSVELDYAADGLKCQIVAPLTELQADDET